jgi:hypothetical protein
MKMSVDPELNPHPPRIRSSLSVTCDKSPKVLKSQLIPTLLETLGGWLIMRVTDNEIPTVPNAQHI